MRESRADASGLDFGGTRGVDVEARAQRSAGGIADLKAIEEVLRVGGTRSGDVQIVEVVLHDLRQSDETLLEHVRAGDGNVANVARGERGTLGGVLRIDLIRGSSDLYLLVELLSVVLGEGELVEARVKVERFAGEEEEARLANFGLIVPGGKIAQREAPGAIGF